MSDIAKVIAEVNEKINSFVWGGYTLAVFIAIGLFFTVKTGFFQFSCFGHWMKQTFLSVFRKDIRKGSDGALSQWQSFTTALAGTLGTGNIVGVATAISLGGAGAVFWMWVSALLGMMTAYAERVLGILYRDRNSDGEYIGGPMYYMEKGLNAKFLAILFAVFCVAASFGMGNAAQANAIAVSLEDALGVPRIVTGVLAAATIGIIIFGGMKRIGKVTEKLVPILTVGYSAGCILLILLNIEKLPLAISDIFTEAFSLRAAGSGVMGYVFARAIKYGVSRGVFSNEAGLGASVLVHCTAQTDSPVRQGMWGICEVFIDTIVVSTMTAFAILTGNKGTGGEEILTQAVFFSEFGRAGSIFLAIAITLFALTSIISWSFYGERALSYLGEGSEKGYKIIFIAVTMIGCVSELSLVWDISDTCNGLMAIPNLIAITLLSRKVFEATNKYKRENICGKRKKHNTADNKVSAKSVRRSFLYPLRCEIQRRFGS